MTELSKEVSGTSELAGAQQTAFGALRAGQSFAQAAEAAGVNRTTIYRWVQGDPRFQAAYNAWKQEMSESANSRLLKLAERAVDVVEKALEKGDARVAVQMLKHMAVMRKPQAGSTDVETLEFQMEHQERKRRFEDVAVTTKLLLDKAGFTPGDQRRFIRKYGYTGAAQKIKEAVTGKTPQLACGPTNHATNDATKKALLHESREVDSSQEAQDE